MDTGMIVVFLLGICVGFAIGQPQKFAKAIRSFLGRAGRGAKDLNEQYSGGKREPPRDDRYDDRDRRDDRDRDRDRRPDDRRDYPPQRQQRRPVREVTCERCKGSGRIKPSSMDFSGQATRKCPDCKGYGTIEVER